jgi:predicted O-methyltransferase YrrM
MKPEEVNKTIGDVPYMTLKQGKRINIFIRQNGIRNILELGFCHGVSTCYMAAALEEKGGGSITTIDLEWTRTAKPNIEQLLEKIGQRDKVTCYYEPTSYTWRLMKFLEKNPSPRFDFCYFDGAHNWLVDGFAFFLVDRLLRPNGWIIFDDLDWTYANSPTLKDQEMVKAMPIEERETPQVRKVYKLLVKTHPSYDDFRAEDGWGYAHKITGSVTEPAPVRQEVIVKGVPIQLAVLLSKLKGIFLG